MHVEVHVKCPYYKDCLIQKEQRKISANTRVCILNDNPDKLAKCKLVMNEHHIATKEE